MQVYILPSFGDRVASDVTPADGHAFLTDIRDQRGGYQSNRVRSTLVSLYRHAVVSGAIESSPFDRVGRVFKEKPKRTRLTDAELGAFYLACEEEDSVSARALQMAVLCTTRGEELFARQWTDLANGVISIPAGVTKTGVPHRLHLSRQAQAIVERLPAGSPFLFPGRDPAKPILPTSVWEVSRRIARRAGVGRSCGVRMLRRTTATLFGELKIPGRIARLCTQHTAGDIHDLHYNLAEYGEEMAEAWQMLADRVDELVESARDRRVALAV